MHTSRPWEWVVAVELTTLHSVCFVPHQRTTCVSIPAVNDKVVEFERDEWLSRPTGESGRRRATAAPVGGSRSDRRRLDPSQGGEP